MKRCLLALVVCLPSLLGLSAYAQNARLSGLVKDPSTAVIPNSSVELTNVRTGNITHTKSNGTGYYVFASILAGDYSLSAEAPGFEKTIIKNLTIETAADVTQDIELQVKKESQTVNVQTADSQLTETGGTVSTVIDHTFIDEMPLNGNSLSTLFELTPGVVTNASGGSPESGGGLSVNGQRGTANYLTVDGASENIYVPIVTNTTNANVTGQGVAVSASGGTNGLLPTDDVEEYRIQTSTYSAEYGRTPGGQIGVKTRGGTNELHGSLSENFRNQVMDATDYFIKFDHEQQTALRMNDFGGTLGGPLLKNKLFFFVAHESLLMRQPQAGTSVDVPSSCAETLAASSFQPFLAAFPQGNSGPDTTTALCNPNEPESATNQPISNILNQSYSTKVKDHSTSVRLDANLPWRSRIFFRINDAPSSNDTANYNPINQAIHIWTTTAGATTQINRNMLNEATVNYSQNKSEISEVLTSYDGSNPAGFTAAVANVANPATDEFVFFTTVWSAHFAESGPEQSNSIKAWNALDTLSWVKGRHSLKVGTDYLRRNPALKPYSLYFEPVVQSFSHVETGTLDALNYDQYYSYPDIALSNLSFFGNDTWRVGKKLSVNYGLRWDINPPPSASGPGFFAITGNIADPSTIAEAPAGTPLYKTVYTNLAPRLGFAYSLREDPRFGTVLRGGAGLFFDTGSAATAEQAAGEGYPYKGNGSLSNVLYSAVNFSSLKSSMPTLPQSTLYITDPNLRAPRTYQWSLTLEQKLGAGSTLSTSYVGNKGDKLINTVVDYASYVNSYFTNPLLSGLVSEFEIVGNGAESNYQSLQMQFRSHVSKSVDAIASWTWSHNIDTGDSDFSGPDAIAEYSGRANSTNDIRHIVSTAIHYTPSGSTRGHFLKAVSRGWALDTVSLLQTASPLSVTANSSLTLTGLLEFNGLANTVGGEPTVLHTTVNPESGAKVPGGKMLNPAAFSIPTCSCNGNSEKNGYRLFGLTQWDVAASRLWTLPEKASVSLRVDAFNVLNHANFADVETLYSSSGLRTFGEAQNTYAGNFGGVGGLGGGSLNTVFQNGGARSVQLSAKLRF